MEIVILFIGVAALATLFMYCFLYYVDWSTSRNIFGEPLTDEQIKPYYDAAAKDGYVHGLGYEILTVPYDDYPDFFMEFIAKLHSSNMAYKYYINSQGVIPKRSKYNDLFKELFATPPNGFK